jgi:lysophospholipase L1-like esterase
VSGSLDENMPAEIAPISENAEKIIIKELMLEIIERHAIQVNTNPYLECCSGDQVFSGTAGSGSGETRIFAIGASHVTRIIGGLAECGLNVNLARPGWILNELTANDLKKKLASYNIGPADILLLDPVSNSTFCGTDSDGNFVDPVKFENAWHIPGDLNIRPKLYLKIALGHLKKVTDSYPDNKLICLTPIPRYLTGKCCKDPEHVKNFADQDFQDMQAELDKVSDLITAWLQAGTSPSLVMDYSVVADVPEAPVPELVIDGQSIWQEADPVHPTATFYAKLSEAIFSALEDLEAAPSESAPKRARLE